MIPEGHRLPVKQQQVLDLTSQGKNLKEIAEELGMAMGTVKAHRYVARLKLGEDRYRKIVFRNAP